MNVGFFGGTFDPIHLGHLTLARAAQERFALGRVLFVPASVPPHKPSQAAVSFFHRYAMVALATAMDKNFIPSLLEAPAAMPAASTSGRSRAGHGPTGANYSIDTVRRMKQTLKKSDRLFLLIGVDAFQEISQWHEPEALLAECEFIVASRPGYSLADVANALPERLRPKTAVTKPFAKQAATGDLVLPGATVHLLEGVNQNISATVIREAIAAKRSLSRFLDPAVAEYIRKAGLYGRSRDVR